MFKTKIIGTGSCLPEKVLTNESLSEMVDTSDEWIRTRTGIIERRITSESTSTSDLALTAAQRAIKEAGISNQEIEVIIVATTTPDMHFPSTACLIQKRLGMTDIPAFDLAAACSGFNYALSVADSWIACGTYKNILLVGADTLAKYVDWNDRGTCILFGDGAGAVVLDRSQNEHGILANFLGAEGDKAEFLTFRGGGSIGPIDRKLVDEKLYCIKMDGKEVFKFAVRVLEDSVIKVIDLAGLKITDIALLIPHQANIRIVDHVAKKLGLPKNKVYVNLQKYGNTSAASIPIALDEALKEGKIKKGDIVVLAGFGAGLTYGANVIKW